MTDNPDAADKIVFKTPAGIRTSDIVYAAVFALGAFPLAIVLPVAFGGITIAERVPSWLAVAIEILVILWLLRMAWRAVAFRLRFCVVFHPEYIRLGGGWARREYPYDAIDEVLDTKPTGLRIRSAGTVTRVLLRADDVKRCVEILVRLCPYAVFVDSKGDAHIRPDVERTERALFRLERWQRRKASLLAAGTLFFCAGTYGLGSGLVRWWQGEIALDNEKVPRAFIVTSLMLAGALACGWQTWKAFREVRRLRQERFELAADRGRARWQTFEEKRQ
ncbi:MAG: hypothetical protein HQ581_15000 [Planctomycetes bacterium]|nr:hypothetical protein [Planctomycetota bacterium]